MAYGNVAVKYTTWKKSNTPNYEYQDNGIWEGRREIYDLDKGNTPNYEYPNNGIWECRREMYDLEKE